MKQRAVAALAAGVIGLVGGCGSRAVRDDGGMQAEIARALAPPAAGNVANGPTALPPATLAVVHPATPLRGANGLACFDRHPVVAEALGDRIVQLSADGSVAPLTLPSGLRGPDDLLFDENGALFVTAAASGDVWRRGRDGSWSTIATGLGGVNGIAQDRGGRLFVSTCFLSDGLFEIDPAGHKPPRTIAHDLGCPNAMVADENGSLVVPLVNAGKVIRVRISDGAKTVIAEGLHAPTAVKAAPDGSLVVLESATGTIRALGDGGAGPELAQLAPGLDSFAACGDSVLVSNFLTGAIVAFKPWPGTSRTLEPPGLATPRGLAQAGDDVLVSDGVSIRRLRDGTAEILAATAIDPIPPPYAIALAPGGVAWVTVPHLGEVHRIDLAARTSSKIIGGLDWPTSIVVTPQGGAVIADTGAGRILHLDADGTTRVLATGLISPIGLALRGGQVLTLETEGGRVIALREGNPPALIVSGLATPVGIAVDAAGRVFVAEARTGYLIRVDADGSRTRVAQGFDFRTRESHPAPVPLLATSNGDILVALPADGSVVRVTP